MKGEIGWPKRTKMAAKAAKATAWRASYGESWRRGVCVTYACVAKQPRRGGCKYDGWRRGGRTAARRKAHGGLASKAHGGALS